MSDSKISALTELAERPALDDEFVVVDKSDTTMAASGTDKRVKRQYTGAYVLATSTAQVADIASGSASEATAASFAVPANTLGANGMILVYALYSHTTGSGSVSYRLRFDSTSANALHFIVSTNSSVNLAQMFQNRGTSVQVGATGVTSSFGVGNEAVLTTAVNTTAATTVYLRVVKTTGADVVNLERYLAQVIPSA